MLNKTLTNKDEKIASAPKNKNIILVLLLVVSLLLMAKVLFSFLPDKKATLNNNVLDILVADSPKTREKGLSGAKRIGDNHGLLLAYNSSGEYCVWMKDMNFAIDVIWFDSNKNINYIQENVQPNSYPNTFCASQESQYILEVKAGKAKEWNLQVGDELKI